MAATARRSLLLAFAAPFLRAADPRSEINTILSAMATDLADGLASAFLKAFDPQLPGFATLRQEVEGLLAAADVSASVELREFTAEADAMTADVDWYLQMRSRTELRELRQKREVLRFRFTRKGKSWKITSLEPAGFFSYGSN
jgi:hypothetical protein